jgi:hypothetical protein
MPKPDVHFEHVPAMICEGDYPRTCRFEERPIWRRRFGPHYRDCDYVCEKHAQLPSKFPRREPTAFIHPSTKTGDPK